MTIKIKCPVCNARNEVKPSAQNCRRCQENLTLLYRVKGYSMKNRIQLMQVWNHPDPKIRLPLMQNMTWLVKTTKR